MAWCKLEDTYYDDAKFRRLSEILGLNKRLGDERGAALARGFVSSLWSWAARHAPDGYLPADGCLPADIERVCGWPSAGGRLVAGLLAANFLHESTEGQQVVRIIHRFWERAESHKAAQRKRNQRVDKSNVPGQSSPPVDTRPGDVSLRGEERERRGEERESTKTARSPDELSPVGSNHPEVQFFEAAYRQKFAGPPLSPLERARAGEIIRRCAESKNRWQDVLDFYATRFGFSGHSVEWLAKNLREVLNKRVAPKPKKPPEELRQRAPTREESAKFLAEREQVIAEATSPEARAAAEAAMAKLKEKFQF